MPDNASAPEDPQRVAEAQASYREDFDPAVAGVHAFDRLQKADFTPDQAESVVLTVRELVGDLATKNDIVRLEANMATKDDFLALKTEIAESKNELKTEIAEFRSEIKTELHSEIAGVRGELKTEIAKLRGEFKADLKTEIAGVRGELKTEIAGVKGELKTEIAELRSECRTEFDAIKKSMVTKGDLAQMQVRHTMWTVGIIAGILLAGLGIATTVIIAAMMRLVA
ncbi:MAG: DUF1640 domain-containing protein [Gammaproteobacteria bacterium]|nr:DUF1640 domain-containing protein [Gammaproteobacteria bacterium]